MSTLTTKMTLNRNNPFPYCNAGKMQNLSLRIQGACVIRIMCSNIHTVYIAVNVLFSSQSIPFAMNCRLSSFNIALFIKM